MPTFAYSNSDFVAFTKARASDVNTRFNDIKTFFNTTKLDDSNLQNAGITPTTKLNQTGSTAGQFLASNGSAVVWTSNPLSAQYNVILGSAAQVTAGTATHSTFASVTQADGDRVLVLPAYATTEAWSITKKLYVTGLGETSVITGTLTFTSTADYSYVTNLKVTDTVTLNSGADGINVSNIFLASGKSFTDNGSGNYLMAIQE